MKLNFKKNKAITLISLVVTIIVLLILAGISISMLAGDNSILQKATEAKTNTDNAQAREELQLAISGAGVDFHSGKVQNSSQTLRDYIFSNDGQTSINNELPENATFNSSSNEITYKRITFAVASDGTLSISTPQVFDELPDDFWIADNGTAYINTKYIDMTNATDIDSYGSYGSYGVTTSTKAGTCQYTKLTVPSNINGETVTKFSVANVNNIVALDIEDGITELGNLKTILDTLQTVEKPSSLEIPELYAGDYCYYRKNNLTYTNKSYRVLYDKNSRYGWTEIVSIGIPEQSIVLGVNDPNVTSELLNDSTMNESLRKAGASYNRAITTLNEATQDYITDLADRARCIGSNPIDPDDKSGIFYTSEEANSEYLYNGKFKEADTNYIADIEQLKEINSLGGAGTYWIASRWTYEKEYSGLYFGLRLCSYNEVISENSYQNHGLGCCGKDSGSYMSRGKTAGLRPVIRLKPDVKVAGGKGTTDEPYELGRYTVIEK